MTPRAIHVDDPSTLRALAHPLRLKIIGMLRSDGPQSVGALGAELGAASGSISYHLATLEKHGFVEQAPELARDARERWWRASAETTTFDPAALSADPDRRAAGTAFRRTIVQSYAGELLTHLDDEERLEPEWIAAGTQGDALAWLTAAELREYSDALEALSTRFMEQGDRERPGVRPTRMIYATFPRS